MGADLLVGRPQGLGVGRDYDLAPIGWAVVVILILMLAGARVRWWFVPIAAAATLVGTGVAHALGVILPPVSAVVVVLAALTFVVRVGARMR